MVKDSVVQMGKCLIPGKLMLEYIAHLIRMSNLTLGYPLKKLAIIQPFGKDNTKDPIRKGFYKLFDNKHPGIDFLANTGTQVFASFPGIVVRKESHRGMGNIIATRYGNIIILYAHLLKFKVSLGQVIKKGQVMGLSGNSGEAITEPHLHFEIRDITKPTLKEMVINPPFGKKIRIKEKFNYKVNNTNSTKTLESLSVRYFGIKKHWRKISKINPKQAADQNKTVAQGVDILIPNYQ